jgi:hypothetical protein
MRVYLKRYTFSTVEYKRVQWCTLLRAALPATRRANKGEVMTTEEQIKRAVLNQIKAEQQMREQEQEMQAEQQPDMPSIQPIINEPCLQQGTNEQGPEPCEEEGKEKQHKPLLNRAIVAGVGIGAGIGVAAIVAKPLYLGAIGGAVVGAAAGHNQRVNNAAGSCAGAVARGLGHMFNFLGGKKAS